MKKKTLKGVLLATLLSGMMVATAQATPFVYSKDIYQAGSNMAGSALEANSFLLYGMVSSAEYPYTGTPGGTATIEWSFDVQNLGSATLEIVAEGIDSGEWDLVTLTYPDNTEIHLGYLKQQAFYYPGSYLWRGPGGLGEYKTVLTTTEFLFDILELGKYTIMVTVADPVRNDDGTSHSWVNEIETSTLTVTPVPEPTTLSLLAAGLLGVAAMGRRKKD